MTEKMDAAWKMVTCVACGRRYECTPGSDYYNNTTLEDGVCEPCLLAGRKGARPPEPRMTPLLKSHLDVGNVSLSPQLAREMDVDLQGNPLVKDSSDD